MTRCHIAAALLIAIAAVASAEIPLMTKQELREEASHIVTGKVTVVYTREQKEPAWHHARGVVEIAVSTVEKGSKIEPGDAVYARFWTQRWVGEGSPPPFGSGHYVPEEGEQVRAHLTRNDGGYDVLLPNGIEALTEKGKSQGKP